MAGIKLAASLTRIIRRALGGGGWYAPAPIPGTEFYIEQIAGTNRARMFVLSSYVASVPANQRFRVGVGTNTVANPVTDTTKAWAPDATGVGSGGLWESLDFGAAFIDVDVRGRAYVYPATDIHSPSANTAITDPVAFVNASNVAPEWTVPPFVESITDNLDDTYTVVFDGGTFTGSPTPVLTLVSVEDQNEVDLSSGVTDNLDGTWDVVVPQLVTIRNVTAMFSLSNGVGSPVQESATADVPAIAPSITLNEFAAPSGIAIFDTGAHLGPNAQLIEARASAGGRTSVNPLKDFVTDPIVGISLVGTVATITAPVTIEDYDLSPYKIIFSTGANGSIIRQCLIDKTGMNDQRAGFITIENTSIGVLVEDCTFDGGADARYAKGPLFEISALSPVKIHRCIITGWSGQDSIKWAVCEGSEFIDNLMENREDLQAPANPAGMQYVPGTTYAVGEAIHYGSSKYLYIALANGVLPAPEVLGASDSNWEYTGIHDLHNDPLHIQRVTQRTTGAVPVFRGNAFIVRARNGKFSVGLNTFVRMFNDTAGAPWDDLIFQGNLFKDERVGAGILKLKYSQNAPSYSGNLYWRGNIYVSDDTINWEDPTTTSKVIWSDGNRRIVNGVPSAWAKFAPATAEADPVSNTASIPLSGTSNAEGEIIEARAVSVDDAGATTTDWQDVGTVTAGAWSGSITAPRSTSRYQPQVRVKSAPATSTTMTKHFAAGHIWSIWEQSNWDKMLEVGPVETGFRVPVDYPDRVFAIQRNAGSSAIGVWVNDTEPLATSPLIDYANAFHSVHPGEYLCLMWNTLSGTNMEDALTTAAEDATYGTAGQRDYSGDSAIIDMARSDGQKIGFAGINGWISEYGGAAAVVAWFAQMFTGHSLDGTPIEPGDFSSSRATSLPRFLTAEKGGLYDWSYTRYSWIGPHGQMAMNPNPETGIDAADISSFGDYGLPNTGDTEYDGILTNAKTYMGDANNPESLPWAGPTAGADRYGDGAHMKIGPDGTQRLARIGLHNTLQTLGLATNAKPILNYRMDEATGAYADFGIIGYDMNTERLRRGDPAIVSLSAGYGAAIDPADDHRTEVMGFTINGLPAKRAEIVDGAGPNGEDVARVWPNDGSFSYTDLIQYGEGSLPGYRVSQDYQDRAWLNWLVVDMGQPDKILPALPVQHMGTVALPTTLDTPSMFSVTNTGFNSNSALNGNTPRDIAALGTYESAGSTITSVRMRVVGAFNSNGTRQGVANIHATNVECYRSNDGGITVIIGGGTNLTAPAGTLAAGVIYDIDVEVNRTALTASLKVDGVTVASGAAPAGSFGGARALQFLQRSGGTPERANGTFVSCEAWLNGAFVTLADIDGDNAATHLWRIGDPI